MSDSLAPFAAWRIRNRADSTADDLDKLRIAGKDAQEMLATRGWAFLQNWLAAQQAARVNVLAAEPTEGVESYALKRAYAAGFLKGLRHAYDAPNALVEIARQELEWAQRADERLAQAQGEQP